MNTAILQYLRANGEQLDVEIAEALDMPHAQVQRHLSQLSAAGEVICCHVTRYSGEKKIEGMSYRLSAHVPPRAPGRKPGAAKQNASSEDN
ncbi:MAG: helix-turn-helix transcriptional regulator [Betaproteobacteria bacterium]|jgi:DNA-binding IclR family transcriptional regulator|nr:MAG: helix-turn-helix transcriptional regulator [Betaproteobacteria bacterium]